MPDDDLITIGFDKPVPLDAFAALLEGLDRRYPQARWVTDGPIFSLGPPVWPIQVRIRLGPCIHSDPDDDDGYDSTRETDPAQTAHTTEIPLSAFRVGEEFATSMAQARQAARRIVEETQGGTTGQSGGTGEGPST